MITGDSKDILVSDDSLFFRTKLSEILVEAGHRVRVAGDGREVINEIESDPDNIDLLILDIQMPDIDGFGVLKWINENGFGGKFPILAITGVHEAADILGRLREQGASGLMSKDFKPEEIIFRVNRFLFQHKEDKRSKPGVRVPVSIPVDFTLGGAVRTGLLLNLSETGTFLHTKYELPEGEIVQFRFSLPGSDRVLNVKGKIKWTTDDIAKKALFGGGGIMFTAIDTESQMCLKEFVQKEAVRHGLNDKGTGQD